MNKYFKIILLGLIIWAIPFVTSFFVWDVEAGIPTVGVPWFNALMAFTWAVGFAIAACVYFRKVKKDTVREGWTTGIIWYIELLVLDLIVLVGFFHMAIIGYYPLLLTYLNAVAISSAIGYIKRGK